MKRLIQLCLASVSLFFLLSACGYTNAKVTPEEEPIDTTLTPTNNTTKMDTTHYNKLTE